MAGIVDRAVLSYAQMPDSAKIAMLSEAISQLQSEMAVANSRIEEIDGDFPQQILIGGDDSAATPAEYNSYFKVIDASDGDGCKIGVTSGGAVVAGICGAVKINGAYTLVAADVKTVTEDGIYYVWIHSWIDAVDGAQAEIIVGAADDDDPPDNPNGGVAYASQLAGRVTVDDGAITGITQDYLTGGEHFEILFGDCEGGEIQVTP